mgnify:CR=1 FL=1
MSFFLLEMKAVQNLTAIEKRRVIPLLSSSPILFELCFPTPPDDLADDADGLGHVEIALFDAAGTRCAVTDAVVHLRVSGDGSLFGVSNGDTTSPQPFKSDAVRLFEGRALAVVRAGLRPGECRLRAVCEIDGAELASELAFSVG